MLISLSAAHADTVWMKNGDRLSGSITLVDDGKLYLDTPYGGSIVVKMDAVKTLESKKKLIVREKETDTEYLAALGPAEKPGTVVIQHPDGSTETALPALDQVMAPRPIVHDLTLKGNLDVGLAYKQASSRTQNYHVGLNTQARSGQWRHTVLGSYNREKEDNSTNTDNYSVTYAGDRFFTEKFFWEGRATHRRDWVEDVSRQTLIGTGPGYQFWDDELGAFSLTGLLGHVSYGYRDDGHDQFMATALRWDYSRKLSDKRLELFTQGEVGRPLSSKVDYSLDASLGLRYKVTDWASVYAKYSRNQVGGARQGVNESIFTTGVGATW